jgi:hypothetical protein
MQTLIGIDPGANGGFATRTEKGEILVDKMPGTCLDIYDLILQRTGESDQTLCAIENVGGYRPGNSGPAACKFARHCGHLDMGLLAAGVPHVKVAPSSWMRFISGTVPKDKKERKNAIKAEMQRRYPSIKVTLWNADALGLMTYLLEKYNP